MKNTLQKNVARKLAPIKFSILLCATTSLYAGRVQAQESGQLVVRKEELLKKGIPNSVIQPLPRIIKWESAHAFVKSVPGKPGEYVLVDAKTKKETPYTVSPGGETGEQKLRVEVSGNDIYLIKSDGTKDRLTNDAAAEANPTLSPDGNWVAYTKNNNFYTLNISTKKEIQHTQDGSEVILNGYSSWVYMEEILGRPTRHKAFWWSPSGKRIVFMRFDDTKVPEFVITDGPSTHGYVEKMRYPKPGDPNPTVKIGTVMAEGGPINWSDFNEEEDQYFGTPQWVNDQQWWQPWLNRGQDHLIIYAVDAENGQKKLIYEEKQKTWIDLDNTDRITMLNNGKGVLLQSDRTGWNMIYHYDMNGKQVAATTAGEFTVTSIKYVDEKAGLVYFTARKENSARSDFYVVRLNGKDLKRLTFGEYHHDVNVSPDGSFFITTYQNAGTPPKMALLNNMGKVVLELGNAAGESFPKFSYAKTELIRVKSEDGLFELPALVTWPKNYDPTKKYPVLISIYGGPNAGTVMDRFNLNPQQQWFAEEGLIQVAMDHRASGHFGKKGINYMHRNLGFWEIKDYSTIVKHLIEKGADPKRICITGFSYGGYMSCYALTYGADVFTHGMAGGSVVDWTLYDTHYTERFMDTPQENPEGYKSSSVLTHAAKYKGMLQIVHGAIDENVHLQNSIQLMSRLQDLRKPFELMIYPQSRHGWGGNKGIHFQNLKNDFIYRHLLQKTMPQEMIR